MKHLIMMSLAGLLALILSSCNATDPSTPSDSGGFPLSAFGLPETDDVVGSIDTTNVREIVKLLNSHIDLFDPVTLQTLPLQTYYEAVTVYHPTIHDTSTMGAVSINSYSIATASYGVLNSFVTSAFSLPFGSTSVAVYRNSDAIIGSLDTSLTFSLPVRFSNISRGDSISTGSSLNVSVANPGSGYFNVAMIVDTVIGSGSSKSLSTAHWFSAGASVTIPSSAMSQVAPGRGTMTITKFEPKILTTSTGKKVAVIAETRHVVAVHFY